MEALHDYAARLKSGVALGGAALIFVLVAFWFLAFALFLSLTEVTSQAIAAGVTGLVCALVAGAAITFARAALKGKLSNHHAPAAKGASAPPLASGGDREFAVQMGQLLGQQAAGWTRQHPYGAVGVALAAGVAVGMSPELRRALRGLMR